MLTKSAIFMLTLKMSTLTTTPEGNVWKFVFLPLKATIVPRSFSGFFEIISFMKVKMSSSDVRPNNFQWFWNSYLDEFWQTSRKSFVTLGYKILRILRLLKSYWIKYPLRLMLNGVKNNQVLPMLVGVGASFSINNHLYSGDYLFQVSSVL